MPGENRAFYTRGKLVDAREYCKFSEVRAVAQYVLEIPKAAEIVQPLLTVLPLQLLAYYAADFKGTDVDQPRNLAKTVTVE